MKRAMPAIEATGERQLMLFLPFPFQADYTFLNPPIYTEAYSTPVS